MAGGYVAENNALRGHPKDAGSPRSFVGEHDDMLQAVNRAANLPDQVLLRGDGQRHRPVPGLNLDRDQAGLVVGALKDKIGDRLRIDRSHEDQIVIRPNCGHGALRPQLPLDGDSIGLIRLTESCTRRAGDDR
jgi:hypothetical protein